MKSGTLGQRIVQKKDELDGLRRAISVVLCVSGLVGAIAIACMTMQTEEPVTRGALLLLGLPLAGLAFVSLHDLFRKH